jgi:hypothetical protein
MMKQSKLILPKEEIVVKISPDGKVVEMFTLNALEDLWHDYRYFKKRAEVYLAEGLPLRHKRYLRAALLSLISYLEGVVSKWCISILVDDKKSNNQIREFFKDRKIMDRCKFLAQNAATKDPSAKDLSIQGIKRLRDKVVHDAGIGCNYKVFERLSLTSISEAERDIVEWLNLIGNLLGQEPHTSTENAADEFKSIGQIIKQEYSGEET